MIYFLVTTCLYNDCKIREKQYFCGITRLKDILKNNFSNDHYKIIIIENNNKQNIFLESLGCEVFYTNNNLIETNNKGIKELQDIFDCINYYEIGDNEFIVKITGRYILEHSSEFMNCLKNTDYDCLIKYGSFMNPVNYKMEDWCKFIKQIIPPENENVCVEWNWAKATYLIDDDKIHKVNELGIFICPDSNNYFRI